MKKTLGGLVALLIMGSSSAFAITDDFSVSAGVKSWYNWYEPPASFSDALDGFKVKSSASFMVGPTIKAQYKNLYCGATLLFSTNDYEPVNGTGTLNGFTTTIHDELSRKDLDIVIGYMITKRISINLGYKGIFIEDTMNFNTPATSTIVNTTGTIKEDNTFNLGSIGVGGNIPLTEKVILFLNGNGLIGSVRSSLEFSGNGFSGAPQKSSTNKTAWGLSGEIGAAYTIIDNLSANVGFKYQDIKVSGDSYKFYGPTFGVDYRF